MKVKLKMGTHKVFKEDDMITYLTKEEQLTLKSLLVKIDVQRLKHNKPLNSYYVVNIDEPYAQEVIDLILTRESEKEHQKESSNNSIQTKEFDTKHREINKPFINKLKQNSVKLVVDSKGNSEIVVPKYVFKGTTKDLLKNGFIPLDTGDNWYERYEFTVDKAVLNLVNQMDKLYKSYNYVEQPIVETQLTDQLTNKLVKSYHVDLKRNQDNYEDMDNGYVGNYLTQTQLDKVQSLISKRTYEVDTKDILVDTRFQNKALIKATQHVEALVIMYRNYRGEQ